MKHLSEVLDMVHYYEDNYRHINMSKFSISHLYDLFPNLPASNIISSVQVGYRWPDKWPNCWMSGVYLYIDENLDVQYVGKANHFGSRLSSECKYDTNGDCCIKGIWENNPRFIITIGVPSETWFENAALESYLIEKIKPSNNIRK